MSNSEQVNNATQTGELGEKINELRRKKEMSLRSLASETGLSASYLHRLESGNKKNPSLKTLNALSLALDEELYFYVLLIESNRNEMETLLTRIKLFKRQIYEALENE